MHLFTKSEAAFRLSFRSLVAQCPKLYFWTFTSDLGDSDRRFGQAWHRFFTTRCQYALRADFKGLRVFEPHGGAGERAGLLHCHMVCNQRLPIGQLRRYAHGTGIGQVMKVEIVVDGLEDYLAKYMTKQRPLFGVRAWAALGDWDHTRYKEIVIESREANLYRFVQAMTKDWVATRLICNKLSPWARTPDELQAKRLVAKWKTDPDAAALVEALKGFPPFGSRNEIYL